MRLTIDFSVEEIRKLIEHKLDTEARKHGMPERVATQAFVSIGDSPWSPLAQLELKVRAEIEVK